MSMTTIFTPPASCATHWTYEGAYYNSVRSGLLIQNALTEHPDSNCFPKGWIGFGRVPSTIQVFSPGWCPAGYSTAANSYNGAVTTAVCCPSSFSYMVTYSSINYAATNAQFDGCISTYPAGAGYTTVLGRANNIDLNTTSVTGPLTMWAQPISVAFKQADIALFTTTTSSSSSASTASVTGGPTTNTAPLTSTSSTSSTGTAISSAGNNATANYTSQGLSGGAIAGIVIGAAAIVGLIIGLAIFLVFRRRKDHQAAAAGTAAAAAASGSAAPAGPEAGGPPPPMTQMSPGSHQWNGTSYGYYDPVPQELPTLGYGGSVRRAEKEGSSVPVSHEVPAVRDPVEMG